MRGYPQYNFPLFIEAAKALRNDNYNVISPAEMDIERGFDPIKNPEVVHVETLSQCMERDLAAVARADVIALLPGWEKSEGAKIEVSVAMLLQKRFALYHNGIPLTPAHVGYIKARLAMADTPANPAVTTSSTDEVRVTSRTGGQKGTKMARYGLIPVGPLRELAILYGKGAIKYDDNNYRKGYNWSLSFDAMMRHAQAFWGGESYDNHRPDCPPDCKEHTGVHHLACAQWHCMTLQWFEKHRPEFDDRFDKDVFTANTDTKEKP